MLTEERFAKILSIVDAKGSVTVSDLMTELDASESTVRRDLITLSKTGRLSKVRGGAISKKRTYLTTDDDVMKRAGRNADEKLMVAKYAADLIRDNDFVYIDAGTTTEHIMDGNLNRKAVYVTNAVNHAKRLSAAGCTVQLLGGEFKNTTEAIVGEAAVLALTKYNFTKGFFGTNGITVEKGCTTPEIKEGLVKQAALANCEERYILADDSKFGEISAVKFCDFDDVIILTNRIPDRTYEKYRNIVEVM